jgi:hypothetical protein
MGRALNKSKTTEPTNKQWIKSEAFFKGRSVCLVVMDVVA